MPNLQLARKKKLSPFRKLALGTWQTAYDPSVYGSLTLRMEKAEAYQREFREITGKRLTLSHMMGKASAEVMRVLPDANAILRWNRIYLRKRIGVFFQVVLEDEKTGEVDLSGATIYDLEQKSLVDIVDEFAERTSRVRTGTDEKEKSRGMFRWIPFLWLNFIVKMISFFSYTLNLNLKWAGVPKDPFGSLMITNIGSIGLQEAYAPLVPYSRVPLIVAMGQTGDEPVVEDGAVVPGRTMQVCATFDHRILDGAHAAVMVKTIRSWMENPHEHFDDLDALRADAKQVDAS